MSTFTGDEQLKATVMVYYNQVLGAIATTGAVAWAMTPAENNAYRQALFAKFGTGRPHW